MRMYLVCNPLKIKLYHIQSLLGGLLKALRVENTLGERIKNTLSYNSTRSFFLFLKIGHFKTQCIFKVFLFKSKISHYINEILIQKYRGQKNYVYRSLNFFLFDPPSASPRLTALLNIICTFYLLKLTFHETPSLHCCKRSL